ncbi:carboxypeptidase-like regulatory domain-containing protein [Geomonas oryzisoli]|uniref:Carboxypeptidase-like regulatory domain-containing protein n=1 Tax=Geomonas oryzisoli TaxID=2847992 RepID=A0ABX8J6P0_9BACT|nr:carboxypeptidase-like regulatory domain-containing protein [Geomonas oryzisoli]QWV92379.1 carboxypeptidase-like regulatory domain-containing protein [Geomonas oryzisoli]
MKKLFALMLVLLTLLVGCGGGSDESAKGSVKVTNSASNSVYYLYVSPSSQNQWGPDQLGTHTILPDGSFTLTNVPPGTYDLKLVMSSNAVYYVYGFEVYAGQTTLVNNPWYNYKAVDDPASLATTKTPSDQLDGLGEYSASNEGEPKK